MFCHCKWNHWIRIAHEEWSLCILLRVAHRSSSDRKEESEEHSSYQRGLCQREALFRSEWFIDSLSKRSKVGIKFVLGSLTIRNEDHHLSEVDEVGWVKELFLSIYMWRRRCRREERLADGGLLLSFIRIEDVVLIVHVLPCLSYSSYKWRGKHLTYLSDVINLIVVLFMTLLVFSFLRFPLRLFLRPKYADLRRNSMCTKF